MQTDSLDLNGGIVILPHHTRDSVSLRWAPNTFKTWSAGNANGYMIERYTMVRNNLVLPQPFRKLLTKNPIKVAPLEKWEAVIRKNNYAAIAAQAIFGEDFSVFTGGSNPIEIKNIAEENDQRFSISLLCADLSPDVALLSGLWFSDTTARAEEKYLYRIFLFESENIKGSVFVTERFPQAELPPKNLELHFSANSVNLRWESHEINNFVFYEIERGIDSINFKTISRFPTATLTSDPDSRVKYNYASDSLTELGNQYYYRVRGVTPFGEVSAPSKIANIRTGIDEVTIPVISKISSKDNVVVTVEWDFPENLNERIVGFIIERSDKDNGKFLRLTQEVMAPYSRAFDDEIPLSVAYYKVSAILKNTQLKVSATALISLIDSIPPAAPLILEGLVDDFGVVRIKWSPASEKDFYGYRVFKSNTASEEAFQLTNRPIQENAFTDNINIITLNRDVYYYVAVIDQTQNQSFLSHALRIKLPDKIRPLAPVMLPIFKDSASMILQWIASSSADVFSYEIYRSEPGLDQWIRLKKIDRDTSSVFNYRDISPASFVAYRYTIVAIDSAGNESLRSAPVMSPKIDRRQSQPIKWLEPETSVEERSVTLRWRSEPENIAGFKIFKSINDGSFHLYKTLPKESREFKDALNAKQRYKILTLYGFGQRSSFSEEIGLTD